MCIRDSPNCPDDFIEKFILLLQKYPKALKAGFSICIDDLPDHYKLKEKVIEWESVFWNLPVLLCKNGLRKHPIQPVCLPES